MHRECWFQVLALLLVGLSGQQMAAQGVIGPTGVCKPASMRTQLVGCWILADDPIGQLTGPSVFWTLDVYPTRAAAEAHKGPRSTVLESLGKVWLLNIAYGKAKASHGTRAAEIGPLTVTPGENYSVQYMEAIFNPGMIAREHIHSGPEAWYTIAGQTCLETSDGRVQIGRCRRRAGDSSSGPVYASHCDRHRAAPCPGAYPASDIPAANASGP